MIGNSSDSVEYSLSESACRAFRAAAVARVQRSKAARLSSDRPTDGPQPGEPACERDRGRATVPIVDTLTPDPAETARGDRERASLA